MNNFDFHFFLLCIQSDPDSIFFGVLFSICSEFIRLVSIIQLFYLFSFDWPIRYKEWQIHEKPIGIISTMFANCPILSFSFESSYKFTKTVISFIVYVIFIYFWYISALVPFGNGWYKYYGTYSRHRFLNTYLFDSFFSSPFGNGDVNIAAFIVWKQIDSISSVFSAHMMTLLRIEEFNCWLVYLCMMYAIMSKFISLVQAKITKI